MYPLIVCTTCQFPIGQYYELYKELARREEMKRRDGTLPENKYNNLDITVPLDGVFRALKINRHCCRCRLLSNANFSEYN